MIITACSEITRFCRESKLTCDQFACRESVIRSTLLFCALQHCPVFYIVATLLHRNVGVVSNILETVLSTITALIT